MSPERNLDGEISYDYFKWREDQAPFLYGSLEDLAGRSGLSVYYYKEEENPVYSKSFLIFVLVRLQKYLDKAYPSWQVTVPIRAYGQVPHGQRPPSVPDRVTPERDFSEIGELVDWAEREVDPTFSWTGGVNGFISIQQRIEHRFLEDSSINPPWREFVPEMVLPMADLEKIATGNPRKDIGWEAELLAKNGFSGSLFRSGDIGKGKHHYIGDFFLPRGLLNSLIGKMILVLTPLKFQSPDIIRWATTLMTCRNLEEEVSVAGEILEKIRPDERTGSSLDLRWAAHVVRGGGLVLRTEETKKYKGPPWNIAEIY